MKYLILFAVFIATLECTAYCDKGITASGEPVQDGFCAMDKLNGMLVPFGAKVILPNGKVLIVKDRFGDGRTNCLDIWMETESGCWEWGRRYIECRVEFP